MLTPLHFIMILLFFQVFKCLFVDLNNKKNFFSFSVKHFNMYAPYIVGGFMKYFLFFVLSLLVLVAGCLTSPLWSNGGSEDDEILEGTGMGYRGPIHVRLRMNSGSIMEIDVDSIEDRFVGGAAIEELIDLIIEYNSTDVDAVSGATETSRGFLSAVENAIISSRK